ncbi:MAG: hypothetical protein IT331_16370 [Anaerolineae bacterium]|nr:hypothetical protein [Anaerolineae bacterium]
MADKQKAALNRLTKKLSALRATLSKDERILLDRIVLGNEVAGHKMTTDAARGARKRAVSSAASGGKGAKKVSEVAMHGMTTGAVSGAKVTQPNKRVVSGAQAAVSSGAANVGALLEFDAMTGGYRVTDGAQI